MLAQVGELEKNIYTEEQQNEMGTSSPYKVTGRFSDCSATIYSGHFFALS
jgi:hypothetical protein